jgi:glycosyltransferase involved in cell wall biosynthesis
LPAQSSFTTTTNPVRAALTHILQIGMGWFGEEPGGLNRMYAGLLRGLGDCRASVRGLVAGTPQAGTAAPATLSFFERREASTLKRLASCRRSVRAVLRSEPVDVLAAHFSLYALPLLDMLRDRRFVFHFHGPWADESRAESESGLRVAMKRRVESLVYRRADLFIALSSAFADILVHQFDIARERISVVPGGVDAARFSVRESRREARDRLHLPQDRPLVVAVRRLIHRVGLEGLIDAMVHVRGSTPDALLLIAGLGELGPELAARIAARDLQNQVWLLGFVAECDLPLLYRACDLSIMPSVALEGFGLPTIESLAAGTPVIVTPIGGLPETVRALDPSLVTEDATTSSLAQALNRALRNLASLPSAESCARYAREHFDWSVIARKVLAVYEHHT